MGFRASQIRMKRERGKIRIITYATQTRGAKRTIGSILVEPGQLKAALEDVDNQRALGLVRQVTPRV